MNAAMPVRSPTTINAPQTISITPAIPGTDAIENVPIFDGGNPSSFCVPWIVNISPATMRSNANTWGVNLPITSYIENLRRNARSGPAPTTDECAEIGARVAEFAGRRSDAEEDSRFIVRGGDRRRARPA